MLKNQLKQKNNFRALRYSGRKRCRPIRVFGSSIIFVFYIIAVMTVRCARIVRSSKKLKNIIQIHRRKRPGNNNNNNRKKKKKNNTSSVNSLERDDSAGTVIMAVLRFYNESLDAEVFGPC